MALKIIAIIFIQFFVPGFCGYAISEMLHAIKLRRVGNRTRDMIAEANKESMAITTKFNPNATEEEKITVLRQAEALAKKLENITGRLDTTGELMGIK